MAPKNKKSIALYYPNTFVTRAITGVCLDIGEHMQSESFSCKVTGISSYENIKYNCYKNIIPQIFRNLVYRFLGEGVKEYTDRWFAFWFKSGVAYLWPGVSIETYHKLKAKGAVIVSEMINTHVNVEERILSAEYKRIGMSDLYTITPEKRERETQRIELSDFVFSPSPEVTQTLLFEGIDQNKILETSYGLRHDEILYQSISEKKENPALTYLFVGKVGVRKGVHLLLDAWKKAAVSNARLVVVGKVDKGFSEYIESTGSNCSIEFIDYTKDLKSLYRSADVFVFPSFEEGSPLVTYKALGAGLPVIATPMGCSGIVKDGEEGMVIETVDDLVKAMQVISEDRELRRNMAAKALSRAHHFEWSNVAQRRLKLLEAAIQHRYEE